MSKLTIAPPSDFALDIPTNADPKIFMQGFEHGLKSNTLSLAQMRLSFRLGFRAAKLYLRDLARSRGRYTPQIWRCSTRVGA